MRNLKWRHEKREITISLEACENRPHMMFCRGDTLISIVEESMAKHCSCVLACVLMHVFALIPTPCMFLLIPTAVSTKHN